MRVHVYMYVYIRGRKSVAIYNWSAVVRGFMMNVLKVKNEKYVSFSISSHFLVTILKASDLMVNLRKCEAITRKKKGFLTQKAVIKKKSFADKGKTYVKLPKQ